LYYLNNDFDKIINMGIVRKPRIKSKIDEVLKDLSPEFRDSVKNMMDTYSDEDLEEKLERLIGMEKVRRLIERK
jgi:hypothetical protein